MIVRAHDRRSAQLRLDLEKEEKDFNGLVLHYLREELKKIEKPAVENNCLPCPRCGNMLTILYISKGSTPFSTATVYCQISCGLCGYSLVERGTNKDESRFFLFRSYENATTSKKEEQVDFYNGESVEIEDLVDWDMEDAEDGE